jgi:hypothetical protein
LRKIIRENEILLHDALLDLFIDGIAQDHYAVHPRCRDPFLRRVARFLQLVAGAEELKGFLLFENLLRRRLVLGFRVRLLITLGDARTGGGRLRRVPFWLGVALLLLGRTLTLTLRRWAVGSLCHGVSSLWESADSRREEG